MCNTNYAKNKSINIVIFLFDHTVRVYTNIKISDDSKKNLINIDDLSCEINDNLSYDEIIDKITESNPMGSTDFLAPFKVLEKIKEFEKGEIFFLSDGYNTTKLNDSDKLFLNNFKSRITTLGIGNKSNFDSTTLTEISKNNEVIEGDSYDIIEMELLAQMADVTTHEIDIWSNVVIELCSHRDNLMVGSIMGVQQLSKEEYNAINYVSNINNENLIIENYDKNIIIKKKETLNTFKINKEDLKINKDVLYFIVDQSGSMDGDVNINKYDNNILSSQEDIYDIFDTDTQQNQITEDITLSEEDVDEELTYVKYTLKLPNMKHYQRIIFNCDDNTKFKGQISWDDKTGRKSMVLHDITQWKSLIDNRISKILNVTNELGHNINISHICEDNEKIGNFRKINHIYENNKELFTSIDDNPIDDFSLTELLFFNKKHGMKLYINTLSVSQRNFKQLLSAASSGGYKVLSATATMSNSVHRTPSQRPDEDHNEYKRKDISMCSICYSEIREYVFSCGHCYACKDCAEKLLICEPKNKCSYCKNEITWIRKITMTEDQKDNKHYFKCISNDCFNIASIVAKCEPISSNDAGFHLTYCNKCYKKMVIGYKKLKKTNQCFCGKEITKIKEQIFFN